MVTATTKYAAAAVRSPRLRIAPLGLALAGLVQGALAQNTNAISATGDTAGPVFDITAVGVPVSAGSPGPIVFGPWMGTEAHYAAASGQTLSLRSMVATQNGNNQTHTDSSFNWTSTSLPGSSGLAVGSPFTVTLSFQIDGSHVAGVGSSLSDYRASSRSETDLRLDVYDLDSPTHELGSPMSSVRYSSFVDVDASLYEPSDAYPSGAAFTGVGYGVQLVLLDPIAGSRNWSGNATHYASDPYAYSVLQHYDVNTGVLSLSFDTWVGNRIYFEGTLATGIVCLTTAPSCKGLADFSNTFDAELTASVAGIGFSDYTPGVEAPVPEPAGWALMGFGVLALLWRRRRND
jgi:hypothetical protein